MRVCVRVFVLSLFFIDCNEEGLLYDRGDRMGKQQGLLLGDSFYFDYSYSQVPAQAACC
jgi:hypothetical protein